MKYTFSLIAVFWLSFYFIKIQRQAFAVDFTANENGYLQHENTNAANLKDTVIAFSARNQFVIYKRYIPKGTGQGNCKRWEIHYIDIKTAKDTTIFVLCFDPSVGEPNSLGCEHCKGCTSPDYANSDKYPFPYICADRTYFLLSPDEERLYFTSYAWITSPAVHYYDLKKKKLFFFKAGWLIDVTDEGVIVNVTGVFDDMGNHIGRWFQDRLYDKNGNLIRKVGPIE